MSCVQFAGDRAWILAAQKRRDMLRVHQETLRRRQPARKAVWRCDERHRGGYPKLAEAVLLNSGVVLFAARIRWLPSDELTLRPWKLEQLLRSTPAATLADDDCLGDWLDSLAEWSAGKKARGGRWLKSTPPFELAEFFTAEAEQGELSPWVRCLDHPEPLLLSRHDLFAATR